jgi:3-hydroxyisobutyrate dehydrogenase-like beta-hydroxyacid dehydrogenase
MASRLIDAGYTLTMFDTNESAMRPLLERGAKAAGSPSEVASEAAVVLLSLPVPAIVEAVSLGERGIIHGNAVRTLIDLSTTGPGTATKVAKALAERGITWVDSPVSGGIAGARNGTLAVMVSCPKNTFEFSRF